MSAKLDFDFLSKLYQEDPEKFEEFRAQEIEKLINSASQDKQARLRGLQFQIDAQRKIHQHSPMGACLAISKMMHESFGDLRFYLNQFANKRDPLGHAPAYSPLQDVEESDSATVLQFRA